MLLYSQSKWNLAYEENEKSEDWMEKRSRSVTKQFEIRGGDRKNTTKKL